jgi:hypothetical protein
MSKYVVTQSVTITYQLVVEAAGRVDALDKAQDVDLDNWKEVDVETHDSMYVREFEKDDE